MKQKPKKVLRVHPAPPTSLTQEIPTPDIVHDFEVAPRAVSENEMAVMPHQGRGAIVSDVLGSYTGTPQDGGMPEQDADDL